MSAITTLVSVTTVGTCNAPCSGVMHDEPIFPGLYPPEIAHDLTIAEDWRARITNGRTHLVELDILALHQSHPAGGSGRYTALAHDIARLHSATDAMGGHTIVGIGHFSIRSKFNDGVI